MSLEIIENKLKGLEPIINNLLVDNNNIPMHSVMNFIHDMEKAFYKLNIVIYFIRKFGENIYHDKNYNIVRKYLIDYLNNQYNDFLVTIKLESEITETYLEENNNNYDSKEFTTTKLEYSPSKKIKKYNLIKNNDTSVTVSAIMSDLLTNSDIIISVTYNIFILNETYASNKYIMSNKLFEDIYGKLSQYNNQDVTNKEELNTTYECESSNIYSLKCLHSRIHKQWVGKLIKDCYIPYSNLNLPKAIFNIIKKISKDVGIFNDNVVTFGMSINDINYLYIIRLFEFSPNVKAMQVEEINLNSIFAISVKITGDTNISGDLSISNVMKTDSISKITVFQDKIGINQKTYEVNGLLDIDNITSSYVYDLIVNFGRPSINSHTIINKLLENTELKNNTDENVKSLFDSGKELHDYINQCCIFKAPIKNNITKGEIEFLHSVDPSIFSLRDYYDNPYIDDLFHYKINRIIHEIYLMNKEIETANVANEKDSTNSEQIFSFCELIKDSKEYFCVSLHGIIRVLNNIKSMVFSMTFININHVMLDNSYTKIIEKISDIFSGLCRMNNLTDLLVQDPSIFDQLINENNSVGSITKAVNDNVYFSKRFGTPTGTYTFFYHFDTVNNCIKNVFHEALPHFAGQEISKLWFAERNLKDMIAEILSYYDTNYGVDKFNGSFFTHYIILAVRKISLIRKIRINGESYVYGTGVNMDQLVTNSIMSNGDIILKGNVSINDNLNNTIFKVDDISKTITNNYQFGLGIDYPMSIIHAKDSSMTDTINSINHSIPQINFMNSLIKDLRNANDVSEFGSKLEDKLKEYNLEQSNDFYFAIYKVDTKTLLARNSTVLYHWLYKNKWNGKLLKDIVDPENFNILNVAIKILQEALDDITFFDGSRYTTTASAAFGVKRYRRVFFKNKDDMYLISTGTNLQNYNIRALTNNNEIKFLSVRNIMTMSMMHIIINLKNVNPIFNHQEGIDKLKSELKKNNLESINVVKYKIFDKDSGILDSQNTEISYGKFNITEKIIYGNSTKLKNIKQESNISDSTNEYHKCFTFLENHKKNYPSFEDGYYSLNCFEDLKDDFFSINYGYKDGDSNLFIISLEISINDYLKPTLLVEGDSKTYGSVGISTSNLKDATNYFAVDPDDKYVGINTDERFSKYLSKYGTLSDNNISRHHVYITNDKYPNVCNERIRDISNNFTEFTTFSCSTMRRRSRIHDFQKMYEGSLTREKITDKDILTKIRYGGDISFEITDKTESTIELGQVQMFIDEIDEDETLKSGFGVQVIDYPKNGSANINGRRNIMYVSNKGELHVNSIVLGGKKLEFHENNGDGFLKWDGKKVLLAEP